jgi:two-component sensor histidine kinase
VSYQQLYHDLLTLTPSAVCHCDARGDILQANLAACELFGQASQALAKIAFETLVHPDDRALWTEHVACIRQGDAGSSPRHFRLRCLHDSTHNTNNAHDALNGQGISNAHDAQLGTTYISVDVQLAGIYQPIHTQHSGSELESRELEHILVWLTEQALSDSFLITVPNEIVFVEKASTQITQGVNAESATGSTPPRLAVTTSPTPVQRVASLQDGNSHLKNITPLATGTSGNTGLEPHVATNLVLDQDERVVSASKPVLELLHQLVDQLVDQLVNQPLHEQAASQASLEKTPNQSDTPDQVHDSHNSGSNYSVGVSQPGLWRHLPGLDNAHIQTVLKDALVRQRACYGETLSSHPDALATWHAVHGIPYDHKLVIKLEDITARKYEEQRLAAAKRQAELLLEQRNAILESISDYFLIVDRHMCLSYVNQALAKDLKTSAASLLGQSLWDVFALAPTNLLRRAFVETLALRQPQYAEAELAIAPLAGRTLSFQSYPFQNGFIAYGQDVSTRKHTEHALVQAFQHQETVLNSITSGVSVLSPELVYLYANQVVRDVVPDIVGKRYFDVFPEHKGSVFEQHYTQVLRECKPSHFEARSQIHGFWVEVRVFPTPNGIIIYALDIDKRKKLELRLQQTLEQLTASDHKFRVFFEESVLACTIFAFQDDFLDGQAFLYNKAFETLMRGTAFSDYCNQLTSLSDVITCLSAISHPDDTQQDMYQFERMMQGEQDGYKIEKRYLNHDGSVTWGSVHCTLLRTADRQPSSVISIIQDITERKRSQHALEQALTDKDMLLKEVHHRTKNNMQLIASMLAIQSYKLADDLAKQALLDSRNRINLLADIHRLMYQDSNDNLKDNVVDVGQQLRKLTSNLSRGLAGHTIHLESNIASFNLAGHQAVPLALIANELLTNAFKHAFAEPNNNEPSNNEPSNNEPSNSEPSNNDTIYISLVRDKDNVVLEVRDNGRGLPTGSLSSEPEGLGAIMLTSLSGQLSAQLDIHNHPEGGCVARVAFRVDVLGHFSA